MSFKDLALSGAGGGGGSSYRNVPDNLRSTDTFEALIGLTTSRATLAPGGLKNAFLNDVALEDGDGNSVFTDFSLTLFDGDPTNLTPVKLNLGQSSGPVNVGLSIGNQKTNGNPGDWVTAAITQVNVDYIDIRLIVQQLFKQTKDGVNQQTATLEIEMRPSGATSWINPFLNTSAPAYNADGLQYSQGLLGYFSRHLWDSSGTSWNSSTPGVVAITGKTTSPYVKEIRIAVPNTGAYANRSWEVRIRLREQDYVVSGDNNSNEDRRTIQWESIAGVSSKPLGGTEAWRGLAYAQLFGKASDQISGVPEFSGIFDIGRQKVPPASVWDPSTRVYTGNTWDGVTTQVAWTQCPAWQIKGVIEDDLSGISAIVPGSTLNKWDVLEASKWFSTLVSDGKGGTQPWYSLNWFLEQPMDAQELVNYLAGSVGAYCWDEGNGVWRMRVEKPENAVAIFTKENIVGEFVYSHTDVDSRFNHYTGVFRNEDLRYKEDRVRTFDQADIDRNGFRPTTIALVGCTNRQQALRMLELRKLTSLKETKMVTFVTNRQAALLEPLSVIAVADADLNGTTDLRTTGRVVSVGNGGTKITVRDSLHLEVGVSYSVSFTVPNPNYNPDPAAQPVDETWKKPTITITRQVINSNSQRGEVYGLYLDGAVPVDLPEFAVVSLNAVGLPSFPKQYRVLSVKPDDEGRQFTITAVEIYTAKWNIAANVSESEILAQRPGTSIPSPIEPPGGMFSIRTYESNYTTKRVLTVSWQRPDWNLLAGYRVEYRYNGGPVQSLGTVLDTFVEITEPEGGAYEFSVYAVDRRNVVSLPLTRTFQAAEQVPDSANVVDGFNRLRDTNFTQAGTWKVAYGPGVVPRSGSPATVSQFGLQTFKVEADATAGTGRTITFYQDFDTAPNERLALQVGIAGQGAVGDQTLQAVFLDANGDAIAEATQVLQTLTGSKPINTRLSGFTTAPTGTVKTRFQLIVASDGTAGSLSASIIQPMASTARAGQTQLPAYSPGVVDGKPGKDGDEGTIGASMTVTRKFISIVAYADGRVKTWDNANGQVTVWLGGSNATSTATISVVTAGCTGTINTADNTPVQGKPKGYYTVTEVDDDGGTLTISAVINGQTLTEVVSVDKLKGGYEILTELPTVDNFEGRIVYLKSDGKLYRYTASGWTSAIPAADLTGTVQSSQLGIGVGGNQLIGAVPGTNPRNYVRFAYNPDGVQYYDVVTGGLSTGGQGVLQSLNFGYDPGPDYSLPDGSTFMVYQPNPQDGAAHFSDLRMARMKNQNGDLDELWPIEEGKTYEFSLWACTYGCRAAVLIVWFDGNGNALSETPTGDPVANSYALVEPDEVPGRTTLNGYKRIYNRGKAPAGARQAMLVFRKAHTSPNATNTSRLFGARPMFAETTENATEMLPYSVPPYGFLMAENIVSKSVTTEQLAADAVWANNIKAGAVDASKMSVTELSAITAKIGLLRTASAGARTEIRDNLIQIFDSSNTLRIRMGFW